jgi:hypothetical protein
MLLQIEMCVKYDLNYVWLPAAVVN